MIRKNRVGASKVDISSEWRHCVLSRDFEFPLFTFWYAWLGRTPDFWATPTSAPLSLRASHRQQMDSSDVIRHGSRWSSWDSFWLESGQAKWIYRVSDVIENYHVTGIYLLAIRKLNYLVGPPKLGNAILTTPRGDSVSFLEWLWSRACSCRRRRDFKTPPCLNCSPFSYHSGKFSCITTNR